MWNAPPGSPRLMIMLLFGLIVGAAMVAGLMFAPSRLRRPIVSGVVFVSGLVYVLWYIWPAPIGRAPDDAPRNTAEAVSFWLTDAIPVVGNISNVLAGFLLGLGIYSLLRIHLRKVAKQQKDWGFSIVLLLSLISMAVYGLWDWKIHQDPAANILLADAKNWTFVNEASDLLFDGLLQQMDSAMFSLIAFYILSAAYRAFRMRSIEASILLGTALLVMLSLMGAIEYKVDAWVAASLAHSDPNSFWMNFQLTSIADWLKNTVQNSSIRGIEFGVGIGLLAMGLRIWLSLERTGEAM